MAEYSAVAIVGVGLIGGSIGLALRERKLAREVVGIGRREKSLASARQIGAIDRGTTDVADGVKSAEIIVVCTPVDTIVDFVARAAAACPKNAILTDAGSTKQTIVVAVEKQLGGRATGPQFVGSHPLAGDQRSGSEYARDDLLEGRMVVVTPTDKTPAAAVETITRFWQSLGATVVTMSPAEHDAALAVTSHLPHLVAAALAAATPEKLLPLAAGGWRDTTRIAGGDPALWEPIFTTNREQVLAALAEFGRRVDGLRHALESGDQQQLLANLEQAKRIRDALGN